MNIFKNINKDYQIVKIKMIFIVILNKYNLKIVYNRKIKLYNKIVQWILLLTLLLIKWFIDMHTR